MSVTSCPTPVPRRLSALPMQQVLPVLSGRWTLAVVEAVAAGRTRFNDLHRHLEGINHKVLIETLRRLQRDGYLRGPLTGPPRRTSRDIVEYRLTELGVRLHEMAGEIQRWSERHAGLIEQAQHRFDAGAVVNALSAAQHRPVPEMEAP
ncbi:helix-turn-helix domain-containing protein [Actinoplanes sp. N902-109]|uniref:winged helix-turn-helix transcriptional regulator n=1 Tax=Actinoplanes sp. (strain N902-109) TaxID=649831 RepID=UPI0003294BC4|nr:helix-turn-helix domain-containing protein [Actinoplanes sp. N902-109]AGL15007.1 HxlR family transcriptional regulator [Actinoplanes sp. N902-109]